MRLCARVCSHDVARVSAGDYDRRTALHLAASEGLLEVVTYLVAEANTDPSPVDRWGGTPLDE
jgi:glutaminase